MFGAVFEGARHVADARFLAALSYATHPGEPAHYQQAHSHGPPTEGGDYAAGALSVAAPSLTPFKPLLRCLYGEPPFPALRTGLRDGREAKVRPAAASKGRPSAGIRNPSHSCHLSIAPTNLSIRLPIYLAIYPSYQCLINLLKLSNLPVSLLLSVHLAHPTHYLCAI